MKTILPFDTLDKEQYNLLVGNSNIGPDISRLRTYKKDSVEATGWSCSGSFSDKTLRVAIASEFPESASHRYH